MVIVLIPILSVVYDLATFLRWQRSDLLVDQGIQLDYLELLSVYLNRGFLQSEGFLMQFDRAGFIDLAIESIVYSKSYEPILNISYYLFTIWFFVFLILDEKLAHATELLA